MFVTTQSYSEHSPILHNTVLLSAQSHSISPQQYLTGLMSGVTERRELEVPLALLDDGGVSRGGMLDSGVCRGGMLGSGVSTAVVCSGGTVSGVSARMFVGVGNGVST